MSRKELQSMCEEYIHQIWCIHSLADGGIFALYGLEQHRIELHEMLCEAFQIDRVKSKEILSHLDTSIGLDLEKTPSESDMRNYSDLLVDKLLAFKECEE